MQNLSDLQKVIQYLEKNNALEVNGKEIEGISNYAYENMQSVIKNIFNETVPSFQKRLKLKSAFKAALLTKSIKDSGLVFQKPLQLFMPELKVYFKGIKTDYSNNEIDKLWDTMDVAVENTKQAYYGLIIDQPLLTTNLKCRFEACIYAPNTNSDMNEKKLFGRQFLKYTYTGSYDRLDNYYRLVYQDLLLQRNILLDNSPIIEHYEMNDMNSENEQEFVTHIYVPVK